MTGARRVDALVIGSGVAGMVTAVALAQSGMDTLIVDAEHVGAPTYQLMVSGAALRGLTELDAGGPPRLSLDALELRFGAQEGRVYPDTGVVACDRRRLHDWLRELMETRGTACLRGQVTAVDRSADGTHRVVVTCRGAGSAIVLARHVVIATGAAASLASRGSRQGYGIACAQRLSGVTAASRMLLMFDTPARTDPRGRLTCVRVLPGAPGECTLSVATVAGDAAAEPERLIATARATLADVEPDFAGTQPVGPLATGPLNSAFTPELAGLDGRLVVGDAAGLVNPFTGDGLTYAVHSGLMAAGAIAGTPDDPDAAQRRYARRLASEFVGYFETARHATRRYHAAWRVFAATAHSGNPFFAKGRRAILLPEGPHGIDQGDRMNLAGPDNAAVQLFLAACDEIAVSAVRTDWPFIGALLAAGEGPTGRRLRPAVLFLAAFLANGVCDPTGAAPVGAAIELAMLGSLSFLGPPAVPGERARGVDWASATSVLAGDFLIGVASKLIAQAGAETSWAFADFLAELTALRAGRLGPAGNPAPDAAELFGCMLEFPARMGAQLGGAPAALVQTLRDFGYRCGRAFLHGEDVLAVLGAQNRLEMTLPAMLEHRISALPDLLGAQRAGEAQPSAEAALDAARAACRHAYLDADNLVAAVPNPMARRILSSFAEAVAAPATR